MSTAYLISSKEMERGSNGRTIPLFLAWSASLKELTLADNDLDDLL